MTQRLILAISGASGAIYGVRLLQILRTYAHLELHLIITPAGWMNIEQELDCSRAEIESLAHAVHPARDIGACIASGSLPVQGMVVAPCSMRSLAAIAHGLSDTLLTRAADVTLKERRKLVLMVRETPLTLVHLRNMVTVTEMGGVILPPMPAFYQRPASIAALVDHTVGRVLDQFGLAQTLSPPWPGLKAAA